MPMLRSELSDWLRLMLTPGVGTATARQLLGALGPPDAIFSSSAGRLADAASPAVVRALQACPDELALLLPLTWQWLNEGTEQQQRHIVTLADPDYPAALLATDDPPVMLYLLGQVHHPRRWETVQQVAQSAPAPATPAEPATCRPGQHHVAVVGSRNPTPQGSIHARQFARELVTQGCVTVSGLALGIDGAAHRGSLEGLAGDDAGFATIAVVGTGLDRVYPASHRGLAHDIANQGLIVSEYPLSTKPLPSNFPRRNRIIAGLSRATLVVEAALQSGSLITARQAVDMGKDVFAIPGSIQSTQSRGCHALIKQGAKLVESAQDILEELPHPATARARSGHDEPAAADSSAHHHRNDADASTSSATNNPSFLLLRAMGHDPVSFDNLAERTGKPAGDLQAELLGLELDGSVARLPGGLFQRLSAD
jgi:DNA processing protein